MKNNGILTVFFSIFGKNIKKSFFAKTGGKAKHTTWTGMKILSMKSQKRKHIKLALYRIFSNFQENIRHYYDPKIII